MVVLLLLSHYWNIPQVLATVLYIQVNYVLHFLLDSNTNDISIRSSNTVDLARVSHKISTDMKIRTHYRERYRLIYIT